MRWRGDLVALAIVVLGLLLRLRAIGDFWNNADEGVYYRIAHAPSEAVGALVSTNAHPPLYYALLRAIAWAGDDIVTLRVPALVFGTLAIFALYRVGRDIGGVACGWLAALLLAISPAAIVLSQLVRPYSLEVLLLIASLGFAHAYLRGRSRLSLTGYTLSLGLACLLHYSAFLVGLGYGVLFAGCALAGRLSRRDLAELALAHLPLAVLAAVFYWLHVDAVLLQSLARAEAQGKWLGVYFTAAPVELWWNTVGWFEYVLGRGWGVPAVVVWGAACIGCWLAGRRVLVGASAIVLAVAWLASAASIYPFGGTRHSVYLIPWLLLPIAVAVGSLFTRRPRAVWMAAAVVAVAALGLRWADFSGSVPADGSDPEQSVLFAELHELREPLEQVRATPGVVFMDLSTAYTLVPVLGTEAIGSEWSENRGLLGFAWGERRVVVVPHWFLGVGSSAAGAPNHLNVALRGIREHDPELAERIALDTRVISAGGRRIPRSIRGLGRTRRELVSELATTRHLSLLRLDVDAYRGALRARLLEHAAEAGS